MWFNSVIVGNKQNDTEETLAENPPKKAHLYHSPTQEDFMCRNLRWDNVISQAKQTTREALNANQQMPLTYTATLKL